MDNEILFSERQRFKQWWVWMILIGINALFLFGVYKQVINGQQFGDKPMSDTGLLLTTGLTVLITMLFASFRLDTIIKRDGIYVRFFPFHLSFKKYAWNTISKSFVRQYAAISEYGGWGIRFNLFGNGKAYNVSGNKGLQLEFNTNEKLLIGTCKPAELTQTLNTLDQLKQ
jgi:hypothetical protein